MLLIQFYLMEDSEKRTMGSTEVHRNFSQILNRSPAEKGHLCDLNPIISCSLSRVIISLRRIPKDNDDDYSVDE